MENFDWDGLLNGMLKVGSGVGSGGLAFGLVVLLIKHFFLSGVDLLDERRRKDESSTARAVRWEAEWKTCERCRVLAERRLDLLSWSYDELLKSFRELVAIPAVAQIAPANLLNDAEDARDAHSIVESVQLQQGEN